jgi:hypothetical protein
LFDSLVWFGVSFAYIFRKVPTRKIKRINRYVLISDNLIKSLKSVLKKKVILKTKVDKYEHKDEIILDANFLTYKEIISIVDNRPDNKKVTFKILPNNTNFILGSDDSTTRGEVITF